MRRVYEQLHMKCYRKIQFVNDSMLNFGIDNKSKRKIRVYQIRLRDTQKWQQNRNQLTGQRHAVQIVKWQLHLIPSQIGAASRTICFLPLLIHVLIHGMAQQKNSEFRKLTVLDKPKRIVVLAQYIVLGRVHTSDKPKQIYLTWHRALRTNDLILNVTFTQCE